MQEVLVARLAACPVPLGLHAGGVALFLVLALEASSSWAVGGGRRTERKRCPAQPEIYTSVLPLAASASESLRLRLAGAGSSSVAALLKLRDARLRVFLCSLCLAALFSPAVLARSLERCLAKVNGSGTEPPSSSRLGAVLNYCAVVERLLGGGSAEELLETTFSIKCAERQ